MGQIPMHLTVTLSSVLATQVNTSDNGIICVIQSTLVISLVIIRETKAIPLKYFKFIA